MQAELIEVESRPGLLGVGGPLGHARQTIPFLAGPTLGPLDLGRCRLVERRLGMDVADEMDIGGQVRQDAPTAVGAVAEQEDLIVGEPAGRQEDEFQGQFRSGAMIGIGLALALALALAGSWPWPLSLCSSSPW